eukprot:TRINITY_DN41514_c0_g1_i1.p1 TRINITY_DN41514_c0_g1~~TRINITY_DN41514_c0_g1_i1.p1  ORF type:complete len:544 (-),score=100.74 TRINITY_DN41514_c0_g1_i1:292-1923(-)
MLWSRWGDASDNDGSPSLQTPLLSGQGEVRLNLENGDSTNVQQMLSDQLLAVQQVLEFNKSISEALSQNMRPTERSPRHSLPLPLNPKPPASVPKPRDLEVVTATADLGFTAAPTTQQLDSSEDFRPFHHPPPSKNCPHMRIATMKQKVIELREHEYHVEDYYEETGVYQAIARHDLFHLLGYIMIVSNVIWIGIDVDYNKADYLCDAPLFFQVVDNVFCAFFFFELEVRYLAFKDRASAFRDYWFCFDLSLVALMIWDTWIYIPLYWLFFSGGPHQKVATTGYRFFATLRILRILRVSRAARAIRLFYFVPELRTFIRSLFAAIRSVTTILCFLGLTIYVFSLFFVQLVSGRGIDVFDSVSSSMNFLMLQTFCGFDKDFIQNLQPVSYTCYCLFLVYVFTTSLTLLNILVAVLCQVISVIAEHEDENEYRKTAMTLIEETFKALDGDCSSTISEIEFESLFTHPDMVRELHRHGVDVIPLIEYLSLMYGDVEEIALTQILEMVGKFRGTKSATVKDLVDVRKFIALEVRRASGEAEEHQIAE